MKVDWDDEIPNRQKKSNVPKHQTETHVHPWAHGFRNFHQLGQKKYFSLSHPIDSQWILGGWCFSPMDLWIWILPISSNQTTSISRQEFLKQSAVYVLNIHWNPIYYGLNMIVSTRLPEKKASTPISLRLVSDHPRRQVVNNPCKSPRWILPLIDGWTNLRY